MKSLLLIFTLIIVNIQFVFAFELEQKQWSLIKNVNNVLLAATANITTSQNRALPYGRELQLSAKRDMSNPEALLANYYWLLKRQQLSQLADFYTTKDGSRGKFKKALETNRLNLTKFNLLEHVKITGAQQWSNFTVYSLKLFAGKKGKMDWQERIVCEQRCYLVFSILEKSAASELLNLNESTFYDFNVKQGNLTNKINFLHKPINIEVEHPEGGLYKGKSNSLTYHIDLVKYPKTDTVKKGIKCDQYNSLETNAFCVFLEEAEEVNPQNELELNKYIISITGKDKARGRIINTYVKGQVKSQFYAAHAFITLVKSWHSIEFVGYIEDETTRYVLFKPNTIDNQVLPIQVVTFTISGEEKSNRLIYGDNWDDVYFLFYNDIFMNKLEQML
ncbi:MAG: hypothetical protein MJK12_16930 [Colwellia sp.]|nr:hypothetical protein [Colwellia sp.]